MRISDWSSDVCSSDLAAETVQHWQVVFIGETAGRRAVDIGLVGEKDRGRMFAQDRTQPGKLGGVDLHRGGITAEHHPEIGRASCRERVCQYVKSAVVVGPLK